MRIKASVTKHQCQMVMDEIVSNQNVTVSEIMQTLNMTENQVNEAYLFLNQEQIFDNMRLIKDVSGQYSFVSTSSGILLGEKGCDFCSSEQETDFTEFVEIEVPEEVNGIYGTGREHKEKSLPTIFVSYNWGSKEYVDMLDKSLEGKAQLHRDTKKIGSWDSISKFMDTIRDQDFAILVVSDEYLKSVNCMYEVMQLMQERKYRQRMMPIVRENAHIYDPLDRLSYVEYWSNYCDTLETKIKKYSPASTAEASIDLRKCQYIRDNIAAFMNDVSDMNNPRESMAVTAILSRLGYGTKESYSPSFDVNTDLIDADDKKKSKYYKKKRQDLNSDIMRVLSEKPESTAVDIAETLSLTPVTVSRYLQELIAQGKVQKLNLHGTRKYIYKMT